MSIFLSYYQQQQLYFFVWICNGLWHGASMKYVMYGMYYYILMVIGMFMEPVFHKILEALHIQKEKNLF